MNPYNRAEIIDHNFLQFLKNNHQSKSIEKISLSDLGLSKSNVISIFESQVVRRLMDIKAIELKEKG